MNDALAEDGVEFDAKAPQTPMALRIFTNVSYTSVKRTAITPESDAAFAATPFECPLCLRFCSAILRSTCCQFYTCHDCAETLRAASGARVACPHCRARPLVLEDPSSEDPIQCYRDSPSVVSKIRQMNIQLCSKKLLAGNEDDGEGYIRSLRIIA
jgi:DNA-directed RNA polymerase subunit RPC12/RpoP